MKILYVITGLGGGGAEKVVVNLADKMVERGHIVKIAYLKGNIVVKPQSTAVELVYLGFENAQNIYPASKRYRKLVREFQPDIIHAHMVHANIFTRLNRIGCNIPKLICTAHNSNEGGYFRMFMYRITNFLSNYNTNVSHEATQSLIDKKAFSEHNLSTMYNGINLNKFSFQDKNIENLIKSKIFLSVGRLEEQKDYPNLLKAIYQLKNKEVSNMKFYIAGEGILRDELEKLIIQYGLDDVVVLLGRRNDIIDLLHQADFFILSSKFEGLPTVVIEAMACGCFVIATDCGGSAEIMGETGILVPAENSDALAEGIEKALSLDIQQIIENNRQARNRIETLFDLEKIVTQWEKLYVQ